MSYQDIEIPKKKKDLYQKKKKKAFSIIILIFIIMPFIYYIDISANNRKGFLLV